MGAAGIAAAPVASRGLFMALDAAVGANKAAGWRFSMRSFSGFGAMRSASHAVVRSRLGCRDRRRCEWRSGTHRRPFSGFRTWPPSSISTPGCSKVVGRDHPVLLRALHAPLDTATCPGLRVEEFLEQAELGLNSYLPTKNSRGELVLLLHAEKLSVFVQVLTRATRRMHRSIREHGAPVR